MRCCGGSAKIEVEDQVSTTRSFLLKAEEELPLEWQEPVMRDARIHAKSIIAGGGKLPWCCSTDESLQRLGSGIWLHIRFLCKYAALSACLVCITFPVCLINYSGSGIAPEDRDGLYLAQTSLGNAPQFTSAANSTVPIQPNEYDIALYGSLSREYIAYAQGLTEVVVTLLLLYLVGHLRGSIEAEKKRAVLDRDKVDITAFSVWVRDLPRDATKQELIDFFDRLGNLQALDWTHGACCTWCGRKTQSQARPQLKPETAEALAAFSRRHEGSAFHATIELPPRETANPVPDVSYAGDADYVGKWVADLNVAKPNGQVLLAGEANAQLNKNIRLAVERARIAKHRKDGQSQEAEKRTIVALGDQLHSKQEAMLDRLSTECVGAFITFENEASQRRVVADYRDQDMYYCCGTPPALQFRGQHRIRVVQADDPSTIAWENIEISNGNRCVRSVAANVALSIVLLLTLVLIVVGTTVSRSALDKAPDLALCQTVVPGLLYGGSPPGGDWAYTGGAGDSTACNRSDSQVQLLAVRLSHVDISSIERQQARLDFVRETGQDLRCAGTCFSSEDTFTCKSPIDIRGQLVDPTSATLQGFPASTVPGCFCLADFSQQVMDVGIRQAVDEATTAHGGACLDVARAFLTAQSISIGNSMVVVAVNLLLVFLLGALANYQRFASASDSVVFLASRLLVAQVINTGLIVLLVNAHFKFAEVLDLDQLGGIFVTGYKSFSSGWYASVGVGVCISTLANVFVPHVAPLAQYYVTGPCMRRCCLPQAVTQEQLNKALEPPAFDLPTRVAAVLTTVCIAIVYSPGMPVMHFIALLGTTASLFVDKFLIFRVYTAPPRYDSSLADLTVTAMFVAVLVRTGVSVYMLGEPGGVAAPTIESSIGEAASAGGVGSGTNGTTGLGDTVTGILDQTPVDPFGLLERATQLTTLPLVLVLVLLLLIAVLNRTLGRAFWALVGSFVYFLTCFACCKPEPGIDDIDSYIPALSQPFNKLVAEGDVEIVRDRCAEDESVQLRQSKYFPKTQYAEERVWTSHGQTQSGRYHDEGQSMLTCEVLQQEGLHTYRLADNPRFKDIVQNLEFAQREREVEDALKDMAGGDESGQAAGLRKKGSEGTAQLGLNTSISTVGIKPVSSEMSLGGPGISPGLAAGRPVVEAWSSQGAASGQGTGAEGSSMEVQGVADSFHSSADTAGVTSGMGPGLVETPEVETDGIEADEMMVESLATPTSEQT